MRLGVLNVLLAKLPFEEALDYLVQSGLDTVEIGSGGYTNDAHCKPAELLADPQKLAAFQKALADRNMTISALSCHGNPLHPNRERADQDHQAFVDSVLLAEKLGVDTVITFSGCPGESETSQNPSWVTCAWPDDFSNVLEWQWNEKVIPYWKEQNEFAKAHHVRVALEAHPGFVVYNTETMLRLRHAAGDHIGINFDPSHLFWQGIDPVAAIKVLGQDGAIFHVHAKDTGFYKDNMAVNGVLDTKSYRDASLRSWMFRTVGYGHGEEVWRDMISMLNLVGYDGTISIEHEDSLMSVQEGLQKAIAFLQKVLIREKTTEIWWA